MIGTKSEKHNLSKLEGIGSREHDFLAILVNNLLSSTAVVGLNWLNSHLAVPKSLDSSELWQSCLRKNPRSSYIILLQTRKKGSTSPVSGLTCGQWRKTTPVDCLCFLLSNQSKPPS